MPDSLCEFQFNQIVLNDALSLRLCYIQEQWAYFTTQNVKEQWGDDWNDRPYEHNAGMPYHSREGDERQWQIVKIAFDADLDQPSYSHFNSPYSVEDINNGAIAWLRSPSYSRDNISIMAGASLFEFIEKVNRAGGKIFLPME